MIYNYQYTDDHALWLENCLNDYGRSYAILRDAQQWLAWVRRGDFPRLVLLGGERQVKQALDRLWIAQERLDRMPAHQLAQLYAMREARR